jgi:hypothetical protein
VVSWGNVLDLGGYDAILRIDWLKRHNPMTTKWEKKFILFDYKGKQVTLHGVNTPPADQIREVSVE